VVKGTPTITPGITKILTITSTITPVSTKSWVSVGTEGLTTGGASWTSIKGIGKDLYVAYIDANDGFAKCMKYSDSASAWTSLGTISSGMADRTAIYIDNGNVYVAYVDTYNGSKITVKEYNGTWQTLGTEGVTPGSAVVWQQSLRVYNGDVYISYCDNSAAGSGREAVMKYSAGTWSDVGSYVSAGQMWYANAVVDTASNTVYSIYQKSNYGIETKSMPQAGAWNYLSASGLPTGTTEYIWMEYYDNTPYVSLLDWNNSHKEEVFQYNGSGWSMVGSAVSDGTSEGGSLAIENGNLYLVYTDDNISGLATVKSNTGGGWANVGNIGFSAGKVLYTTIYVNNGEPYVAYSDQGLSNKMVVKTYK
jgi:hypothetical protein